MRHSVSSALEGSNRLSSLYIPLLTVSAMAVLLFYVAVTVSVMFRTPFFAEWLMALMFGILAARGKLLPYTLSQRALIGILGAVVFPWIIIQTGIFTRNSELTIHGVMMMVLAGTAYGLIPPILDSTAHLAPDTRQQGPQLLSGDMVGVLIFLGSVVFAVGGYTYHQEALFFIHPLPFALLYFSLVAGLLSLSRMAEQLKRISGGKVLVSSSFGFSWIQALLLGLGMLVLLAMVLPKEPVINPIRWLRDRFSTRIASPFGHPGVMRDIRQWHNSKPPSEAPDNGSLNAPENPGSDESLSEGEKPPQESLPAAENQNPGQQRETSPGDSGSGSDMGDESFGSETGNRHPVNWRLILKILLILLFPAALVWFIFSKRGKQIRTATAAFAGKIISRLKAILEARHKRVSPKQAATLREQLVRAKISQIPEPFADPFASGKDQSPDETACSVYNAFLAYLWLLGMERGESETAYDFALRVSRDTQLSSGAIRTITRLCTYAQFAPSDMTAEQLSQLKHAFHEFTNQVKLTMPAEEYLVRQEAYRKLLAEREVDQAA